MPQFRHLNNSTIFTGAYYTHKKIYNETKDRFGIIFTFTAIGKEGDLLY